MQAHVKKEKSIVHQRLKVGSPSCRNLLKMQILLGPRGLQWDPRICISPKFPSDADSAGWGPHFRNHEFRWARPLVLQIPHHLGRAPREVGQNSALQSTGPRTEPKAGLTRTKLLLFPAPSCLHPTPSFFLFFFFFFFLLFQPQVFPLGLQNL